MLLSQNGQISDALLRWKDNVDKVFEGVEECPICYMIVHASTGHLPKQECKTCHNKFHSACLYKWFTQSQKSNWCAPPRAPGSSCARPPRAPRPFCGAPPRELLLPLCSDACRLSCCVPRFSPLCQTAF